MPRLVVIGAPSSAGAYAPGPVVGDREAVRLVAHALQELERRRVVGQDDRLRDARDEDLLDPLGQRHDRHAAREEPLQRLDPGAELALAAVDHDEARQCCERFVALGVVGADLLLGLPARQAP